MQIYDTTLRDGTQSKEINFTIKDKIEILKLLDASRIDYAEIGWPGSNPKDMETFITASNLKLKHTKISAFGSTRRKNIKAEEDPNLKAIIKSKAKVASIFGKTWLQHIKLQLKITPQENLQAIFDSISYLKKELNEVFFDAEHFFDGYKDNKKYTLKVINTAFNAGADAVIMCDTNGGCLPQEIKKIFQDIRKLFPNKKFGIHCHNDSGCGVANSLICAKELTQIQGTINGYGERTGNADLCQIIPGLEFKLNIKTNFKLKNLKVLSDVIYTLANLKNNDSQPYVGNNSFAHKGGIHVDAINKGAIYEHIIPEKVGNKREIILSELSGTANIVEILKIYDIVVDKNDERVRNMLNELKVMEKQGYDIRDLEAEKYLLMQKYFKENYEPFNIDIHNWKIITGRKHNIEFSECHIYSKINNKNELIKVKILNNGPVDAIYKGIKKVISRKNKKIKNIKLNNFKVMIAEDKGAESSVRVFIQFKNHKTEFATIGVSTNIIEASMEAVIKGFKYFILKS
ncbi:MAG: citramalate synthase [Candidatus Woesearchaeota archaeon]